MKAKEKCKICLLKKRKPTAYDIINQAITDIEEGLSDQSMSSVIRDVNKKYRLKITPMNASRHKAHYLPQVIEIKPEQLKSNNKKTTQQSSISNTLSLTLDALDPKHMLFLEKYRENGYRNKEQAWEDAGFGNRKDVYEVLKKPEIRAAIYEMKATDFVAMRYTGNQVLSGIMEIANFPEYWNEACDEDGHLITNIKEWPEGLRHALSGYETTEDVLKSSDEDEGIIIRRKFKYKFPDPLKARAELRKHAVEVEMFDKNNKQAEMYEAIIEKLLLNQINPIAAGLEIDKLNRKVPEALKIAMQKVDPKMIEPPKGIDSVDLDVSQLSDDELDRIILNGVE